MKHLSPQDVARRRRRRWAAPVGVAVIAAGTAAGLLASCDGHGHAKAVPTTVTTVAPTTTAAPTTVAAVRTSPLTGLPQPDAALIDRPAVVVKIDNVDQARPQTGINQADVVYEELVEGGLTRLAAVFQSDYPDVIGPVRSGRLTDSAICDDLNHPVFAYSGTNNVFLPILRSQPLTDVDDSNHPSFFYRSDLAAAPHNLYSDVIKLATADTSHTPPPPLFSFRPRGTPFTGAGVSPAAGISISFPAASIQWTYSWATGQWLRDQNGTRDVDRAGVQVAAENVVVQFVHYADSGTETGEGQPPTPIPEGDLVGSGQVWVFSAAHLVKGSWSRSGLTSTTRFVDDAGSPILLAPGRTWVELVPIGRIPPVQL